MLDKKVSELKIDDLFTLKNNFSVFLCQKKGNFPSGVSWCIRLYPEQGIIPPSFTCDGDIPVTLVNLCKVCKDKVSHCECWI